MLPNLLLRRNSSPPRTANALEEPEIEVIDLLLQITMRARTRKRQCDIRRLGLPLALCIFQLMFRLYTPLLSLGIRLENTFERVLKRPAPS